MMGHAWPGALRRRRLDWNRGIYPAVPLPDLGNLMQRFIAKTKRCDRTGKVSYRDEPSANRAIVNIVNFTEREEVPVRSYKCPFCKHWHLTSREERV
jgi:hypothetical protein